MDTVVDRLIRYAKVYSESDYHAGRTVTPSTDRQFDMAKLLVEELHGLGIENARYDDKCYVYATLDATPGCEQLPAIGLIAHMDTTPDMTGKDVKPQIIHYTGGDVVLWTVDGETHYACVTAAAEGESGLSGLLQGIAEDALWDAAFCGPAVDGAETDYEEIARQLNEAVAENVRHVPDWVSWKLFFWPI